MITFPPTLEAAHARLAAVRPAAYARTRNSIEGAVTRLGPYITHGFLSLPEVLATVAAKHRLDVQHKFVFELGWREYCRHVWAHRGAAILGSLHRGPRPDAAYGHQVPADVLAARTGLPAIDQAVRTLYATGYLHNHARMWLASYLVHLRRVHWRCGADWLYAHLLDGDLASNHLNWQWVAGTGSHKPYVFNADNVARFAPPAWHSPGSLLDIDYATQERRAFGTAPLPADAPPAAAWPDAVTEPPLHHAPPRSLGTTVPDPSLVRGRDVWLLHPWMLSEPPATLSAGTLCLGVCVGEFHRAHPWSAARWAFVGERLAALAPHCWHGDASALAAALQGARSVRSVAEPHLAPWLPRLAHCAPAPALFAPVVVACTSFSRWWQQATERVVTLADLPGLAAFAAQAPAGPLFDRPPTPRDRLHEPELVDDRAGDGRSRWHRP